MRLFFSLLLLFIKFSQLNNYTISSEANWVCVSSVWSAYVECSLLHTHSFADKELLIFKYVYTDWCPTRWQLKTSWRLIRHVIVTQLSWSLLLLASLTPFWYAPFTVLITEVSLIVIRFTYSLFFTFFLDPHNNVMNCRIYRFMDFSWL